MFSAIHVTTFYVNLDIYLVLEYFNLLNLMPVNLATVPINVDIELPCYKPEESNLSFSICIMKKKGRQRK